ncbi:zinc ribbon domain-containing protein [Streptomyces oceani]|uniref:FmdB family zinc ribbon protein n=1 Tax=Streptomyces oceani TaxID=1075402 RepID=UPI0009A0D858
MGRFPTSGVAEVGVARYDYRCGNCGVYEVECPVGNAEPERTCPRCLGSARRLFSTGVLISGSGPVAAAMDTDRRSAHEPAVVHAPPPDPLRGRSRPAHPLHAKLPRP